MPTVLICEVREYFILAKIACYTVRIGVMQGLFQNFAPGGANASGPNIRGGKY